MCRQPMQRVGEESELLSGCRGLCPPSRVKLMAPVNPNLQQPAWALYERTPSKHPSFILHGPRQTSPQRRLFSWTSMTDPGLGILLLLTCRKAHFSLQLFWNKESTLCQNATNSPSGLCDALRWSSCSPLPL